MWVRADSWNGYFCELFSPHTEIFLLILRGTPWERAVPFSPNREHRSHSVDGQEDCQCAVTMSDPDISNPVKRKQKDGTTLMVDCPSSIVAYNKFMGGVNCGGQLQSYYHVRLKPRKFYKYMFWFLFDVVGESSQQRALLNHLPRKAKSTRCLYCCKIRHPTQRKETVWYCPGCEGQPPLCLSGRDDGSDCHSLWHSSQH